MNKLGQSFLLLSILSIKLLASDTDIAQKVIAFQIQPIYQESYPEKIHAAFALNDEAYKSIFYHGDYGAALEKFLVTLEQYPGDWRTQIFFAAITRFYAEKFQEPLKSKLIEKSQQIIIKVRQEMQPFYDKLSLGDQDYVTDEYYWAMGMYKEQFELATQALQEISPHAKNKTFTYFVTYIWQGLGATHYARQLYEQGKQEQAAQWAQVGRIAWENALQYSNPRFEGEYFAPYIHYALALGILGEKEAMMKNLNHAGQLLNNHNHFEIKNVLDWMSQFNKYRTYENS
jgi:hypothetical protein